MGNLCMFWKLPASKLKGQKPRKSPRFLVWIERGQYARVYQYIAPNKSSAITPLPERLPRGWCPERFSLTIVRRGIPELRR